MSRLILPRMIAEHPHLRAEVLPDGALVSLMRHGRALDVLRLGPNEVHAAIIHKNGDYEDLGRSYNLLTNIGRDLLADMLGAKIPAGGVGSPATGSSATSLTATATPWTASNFGTPQLGLTGMRVYVPVTGLTTPPVYGNIGANSDAVITVDQWWNAADGVGATPASNSAFILGAGGPPSPRFMALTTDSGAANAADTALASEITNGGAARALATYAHTYGQATLTLQKAYSITSPFTNIHKMGLLTVATATAGGILVFETVLNQDATVGNGDTLTVTWTCTLSG